MIVDLSAERQAREDARAVTENEDDGVRPIVVLPAGAIPTEPGWYVAEYAGSEEYDNPSFGRELVRVDWCGRGGKGPKELGTLSDLVVGWIEVADPDLTFIARIYPDRIK